MDGKNQSWFNLLQKRSPISVSPPWTSSPCTSGQPLTDSRIRQREGTLQQAPAISSYAEEYFPGKTPSNHIFWSASLLSPNLYSSTGTCHSFS